MRSRSTILLKYASRFWADSPIWASRTANVPPSPSGSPANPVSTDRKSTRLNSSHLGISYAVFCLKKTEKIHLQVREKLRGAWATVRHIVCDTPCMIHSINFFFNDTATTEIYTLSLHDALPI